jgi:hypothetical protein
MGLDEFKVMVIPLIAMGIIAFCLLLSLPLMIYSDLFLEPDRADFANEYCTSRDFDTYERYKAKPLSRTPQGIKCKYADNRDKVVVD